MAEDFDGVRFARIGLEAALAVSESEAARAAWRVYHHVLPRSDTEAVRDACRILDETILRSGDEQLIEAKLRYDLALNGRESPPDH